MFELEGRFKMKILGIDTQSRFTDGTPVEITNQKEAGEQLTELVQSLVEPLLDNNVPLMFTTLRPVDPQTPPVYVLVLTGSAAKNFGPALVGVVEGMDKIMKENSDCF